MIDTETKAWDDKDCESFLEMVHPVAWLFAPNDYAHDPVDWACFGRAVCGVEGGYVSRVGKDTVITLDGGDTVLLEGGADREILDFSDCDFIV